MPMVRIRLIAALAASGLALPALSTPCALGAIEIELNEIHLHAYARATDGMGPGPEHDVTATITGGDGSTFTSLSPAPGNPWLATAHYLGAFSRTDDALSHLVSFAGYGAADSGVSGLPSVAGSGTANAYSLNVVHLSAGLQELHITGNLAAHNGPGVSGYAFIEIYDASTVLWRADIAQGMLHIDTHVFLPGGSYTFRASAESSALGSHPGGPFPPSGGDASYDFNVQVIPAPGAALLLGTPLLTMLRRRRA